MSPAATRPAGPPAHARTDVERELRWRKWSQLERFAQLRGDFAARYEAVMTTDDAGLVEPEWQERNRALGADMLPEPPSDFLRHPSIRYSMFMPERCVPHELPSLVAAFGPRLAGLLDEDPVGRPPLIAGHDGAYATSSNSVHHLFHLQRFAAAATPERLATIVEWGAGYGNLAKLFLRLHGAGCTYVAIDTPLFVCIQWLYLSSVLGPESVHLVREPGEPVAYGKVTLVPVQLAAAFDVRADLFISTWALNESPIAAQDLVVERDWFGADHLLLAMHDGVPLAARAVAAGARAISIGDFLPGQNYLVH